MYSRPVKHVQSPCSENHRTRDMASAGTSCSNDSSIRLTRYLRDLADSASITALFPRVGRQLTPPSLSTDPHSIP